MVVERDPAHVLLAGAEAAAQPHPERGHQAPEQAAVDREHRTGADVSDPDTCVRGRFRRVFPLLAHVGEESAAGRGRLGERLVAVRPVVVDAGRRDQHRRLVRETGERAGEHVRALRARLEDEPLARRRPALVADAGAGEMDDGVDALEPGGVDRTRVGIPGELVGAGRGTAHDPHGAVTGPRERGNERRSDQPARPRDRDVHADSMDAPSAPSSTG